MVKCAVLGWGSLIWKPEELKTAAPFAPNGPLLPIEFCRVSKDGRLTLAIDETFGDVCTAYSAPSAFADRDAAIENLRKREGTIASEIGFVEPASGRQSDVAMERHPQAVATITVLDHFRIECHCMGRGCRDPHRWCYRSRIIGIPTCEVVCSSPNYGVVYFRSLRMVQLVFQH